MKCPLTLAVDQAHRGVDTVQILLSAGATVHRENWAQVLKLKRTKLLQLVLDSRTVPDLSARCPVAENPSLGSGRNLTEQEMKDLVEECGSQPVNSSMWMPLLLKAGLDPHALLQDRICSKAPSAALNLLLQHLNWSCLSPGQRLILDQRQTNGTWDPLPLFDSIPNLFHLCRLCIRDILGSASVMKSSILHQLPVPLLFHHLLQFGDVQ